MLLRTGKFTVIEKHRFKLKTDNNHKFISLTICKTICTTVLFHEWSSVGNSVYSGKVFSFVYIFTLQKKKRRKAPHLYSHLNTATVSSIFVAMVWGCDNYKMGNYGGTEIILQVQSHKSQITSFNAMDSFKTRTTTDSVNSFPHKQS